MGFFDEAFASGEEGQRFRPLAGIGVTVSERWEHKVVGLVLRHFDIAASQRAIIEAGVLSNQSRGGLTFSAFLKLFPSFPVWLHCAKIPNVHETTFQDLATKPRKTRIWPAFVDAESKAAAAKDVILVFEWLKVAPVACFHGLPIHKPPDEGFSLTVAMGSLGPFTLHPFSQFLGSLRWEP